jgi:hypothetical protein
MSAMQRKYVATAAGSHPPRRMPPAPGTVPQMVQFWKKNQGLVSRPEFWRLLPRVLAARARTTVAPADVLAGPGMMFVCMHHKAMTIYFHAVLRCLAFALNLPFERTHYKPPRPETRLMLSTQSKIHLGNLGTYRGVHVMRDPRDMIVSGYHYHKWAHEVWLHRLDDTGESYQEKLNRLDKTTGLFLEIDHFIHVYRRLLEAWDLEDPQILEVSYERLMGPERVDAYAELFRHLGFDGAELALAVDLMQLFEASNRSGNRRGRTAARSHLRSGRSRQWEAELEPAHFAYIEQELGPVLRKFGYG